MVFTMSNWTSNETGGPETKFYSTSRTSTVVSCSSTSLPITTTATPPPPPSSSSTTTTARDFFDDEISLVLINSDPMECNENFSIFIKCIIDNIYVDTNSPPTYQELSLYALKLLSSNLFVKNSRFCIGKILAFLETFAAVTEYRLEAKANESNDADLMKQKADDRIKFESESLKEFLCITLLLLLKLKNSSNEKDDRDDDESVSSASSTSTQPENLDLLGIEEVFKTLQTSKFIAIITRFITTQIKAVDQNESSFVILKFSCDLVFEYLYYIEFLSSKELAELASNDNEIIAVIIKYLLSSEHFNNYDLDSDEFNNESRLVAYEELKLLLLINEQFLMNSYNESRSTNNVFAELTNNNKDTNCNMKNIVGFINLLIYHLNREESQIIKLLILKFLYQVFTTSYTAKLIYRNDLKILIDIFIRELDNLESKDSILIFTYLRVLYPILMYSELSDCGNYKNIELWDVLSHTITNPGSKTSGSEERLLMSQLAAKCMKVKWLEASVTKMKNNSQNNGRHLRHEPTLPSSLESSPEKHSLEDSTKGAVPTTSPSSSSSSITTATTTTMTTHIDGMTTPSTPSTPPPPPPLFTRVASVRSSSRADYHKHTTAHNFLDRKSSGKRAKTNTSTSLGSIFEENNNNVFLKQFAQKLAITRNNDIPIDETSDISDNPSCQDSNILNLPNEYLQSKPLPKIPVPKKIRGQFYQNEGSAASSSSSLNSDSSVKQKARKKKAPPPPPPPPRRRK
ncbi:LDB17 [Candida oxycetoniae]|uniref:LDB17 n=1 Tax=Candida oxycetoniae TaxID=497107 RepID=A0AAI9SW01_9ASCO|nr:LDB17 [Candida oxycetoniae]KAI3404106.2 LDB17 [Candida oxycetoniae]